MVNIKKISVLVVVVFVVILGVIATFKSEKENPKNDVSLGEKITTENKKENSEKIFDKAPSFSLFDFEGEEISLNDFKGKAKVINSWAVWCPFCKKELADFGALQSEFKDELVVIAINRRESLEKQKEFTDGENVTDKMTFLLDPKDSFYKSIGGFAMPETIFLDEENNIIFHKRGPMELDEMREKVGLILK